MKKRIYFLLLIIMGLVLFFTNNCKKEEQVPKLITSAVIDISPTTASCGGNITNDGGSSVIIRGICWNTRSYPTIIDNRTFNGKGEGEFTDSLVGLSPNTTYYLRAYARNIIGTAYGNEISFSTTPPTLPTLTTTAISSITSTTAISGGEITSDGGAKVTTSGVCWSTSRNPLITDSCTTDGSKTETFKSSMNGLTLGATYYVRAYATNNVGTAYGNELSFTTSLVIGDNYQGGIVAYILQPSDLGYVEGEVHGLIAAPSDQSTGIQWDQDNHINYTYAYSKTIGSGKANTNKIINVLGEGNYAAKLCYDLVLGGYSDWFLPSSDELNIFYTNRNAIGGFFYAYYWSSNEDYDPVAAYAQYFTAGIVDLLMKFAEVRVRAVRYF